MKRRAHDNPELPARRWTDQGTLDRSGLHWIVAARFTGTATKAQLIKWLFWILGALGVGLGAGSQL